MNYNILKSLLAVTAIHIGAVVLAIAALISLGCSKQSFGIAPAEQNFGQEATYNTEVDVLFVVDNSDSMAPRQQAMANGTASFISALNKTGLNYRIAVTTTDMDSRGEQGRFVAQPGTPAVLMATTPNLVNILAQRFLVGSAGSRVEQGLAAAKAATSEPNLSGTNTGFMRKNSLLAVVVLSDEDDQSPSIDYKAYLNKIKPPLHSGASSWLVNYIGIVQGDPACTSAEWQYFSPGVKYMNLAAASGGIQESICRTDLSKAVTNMHARLMEVITEYFLEYKPNIKTIAVTVDGVVVPESAINGWTYHPDTNSIRFHGAAIPLPAQKIKVVFEPESLK